MTKGFTAVSQVAELQSGLTHRVVVNGCLVHTGVGILVEKVVPA
jgi:hypothetical protein